MAVRQVGHNSRMWKISEMEVLLLFLLFTVGYINANQDERLPNKCEGEKLNAAEMECCRLVCLSNSVAVYRCVVGYCSFRKS